MAIKYERVYVTAPKTGKKFWAIHATGFDYMTQKDWFYSHGFSYGAVRLGYKEPTFCIREDKFAKAYPKSYAKLQAVWEAEKAPKKTAKKTTKKAAKPADALI